MGCPKGAVKHRFAKGSGHPGNYAHSIRGHTWKKTDGGRVCTKCGKEINRFNKKEEK
ncbi:MAG: hypothetical protein IMZ52_00035 [Actinobacteria bacterium]|nr:hypothetical protein [Actinomycetota bacterium]MBE3114799.1 hypothetical protein [Actinomycetota bacterium]